MQYVFRFDGSAPEISLKGDYTLEQLRTTGPYQYRQVPTGGFIQTKNGRRKAVTEGKEYLTTSVGVFEKREWMRHMEEAVIYEGKTQLLKAIITHVTAHCAWLHTAKERREYALECLSIEAHKHWKDFKTGEKRNEN